MPLSDILANKPEFWTVRLLALGSNHYILYLGLFVVFTWACLVYMPNTRLSLYRAYVIYESVC